MVGSQVLHGGPCPRRCRSRPGLPAYPRLSRKYPGSQGPHRGQTTSASLGAVRTEKQAGRRSHYLCGGPAQSSAEWRGRDGSETVKRPNLLTIRWHLFSVFLSLLPPLFYVVFLFVFLLASLYLIYFIPKDKTIRNKSFDLKQSRVVLLSFAYTTLYE